MELLNGQTPSGVNFQNDATGLGVQGAVASIGSAALAKTVVMFSVECGCMTFPGAAKCSGICDCKQMHYSPAADNCGLIDAFGTWSAPKGLAEFNKFVQAFIAANPGVVNVGVFQYNLLPQQWGL